MINLSNMVMNWIDMFRTYIFSDIHWEVKGALETLSPDFNLKIQVVSEDWKSLWESILELPLGYKKPTKSYFTLVDYGLRALENSQPHKAQMLFNRATNQTPFLLQAQDGPSGSGQFLSDLSAAGLEIPDGRILPW